MTEIQNSHGWALSAKYLGFRRIYFRKRKETLLFARTYVYGYCQNLSMSVFDFCRLM